MGKDSSEKLFDAYYMKVFSYAMTLTRDRTQAEEITQDTFFRAFATKRRFRGESDEGTWLCAIAKNFILDKIVEDRDSSFQIHLALHQLEEPYREVFMLRVFGELCFREIGIIFKKTENWARVTYYRARIKLRKRMGEQ